MSFFIFGLLVTAAAFTGNVLANCWAIPAYDAWLRRRVQRRVEQQERELREKCLVELAGERLRDVFGPKPHPNCRSGFAPSPVPAGRIEADDKSRTITVTVFDHGMDGADRVLIKAPGRKDRIVLLRPWSRKMAKVLEIKPTRKKSIRSPK